MKDVVKMAVIILEVSSRLASVSLVYRLHVSKESTCSRHGLIKFTITPFLCSFLSFLKTLANRNSFCFLVYH